ncbi:hypothetical protein CRYUN_Cryun20dG0081600 [Craigia yunnanensis]
MVFSHGKNLFGTLLVFSLLVTSLQVGAMRPLDGKQWLAKDELVLQSHQRGPVTIHLRTSLEEKPASASWVA